MTPTRLLYNRPKAFYIGLWIALVAFIALVIALALAPKNHQSTADLAQSIELGMSKQQVKDLIGDTTMWSKSTEPGDNAILTPGQSVYMYPLPEHGLLTILFNTDDTVIAINAFDDTHPKWISKSINQ